MVLIGFSYRLPQRLGKCTPGNLLDPQQLRGVVDTHKYTSGNLQDASGIKLFLIFPVHMRASSSNHRCQTLADAATGARRRGVAVVGWGSKETLDSVLDALHEHCPDCRPVVTMPGSQSATNYALRTAKRIGFDDPVLVEDCTKQDMTSAFRESDVSDVHFVYSGSDFPRPGGDAMEIGELERCHIAALEALAQLKHVTNKRFYLHMKDRFVDGVRDDANAHKAYPCTLNFDHSVRQDVLLKSLDLYCGTYQRLYEMEYYAVQVS